MIEIQRNSDIASFCQATDKKAKISCKKNNSALFHKEIFVVSCNYFSILLVPSPPRVSFMFLDDFLQLVLEDFTLTGYIKLIEKLRRVSFISSIIVSAPKSGYYLIFSEGGGLLYYKVIRLQGFLFVRLLDTHYPTDNV